MSLTAMLVMVEERFDDARKEDRNVVSGGRSGVSKRSILRPIGRDPR